MNCVVPWVAAAAEVEAAVAEEGTGNCGARCDGDAGMRVTDAVDAAAVRPADFFTK